MRSPFSHFQDIITMMQNFLLKYLKKIASLSSHPFYHIVLSIHHNFSSSLLQLGKISRRIKLSDLTKAIPIFL